MTTYPDFASEPREPRAFGVPGFLARIVGIWAVVALVVWAACGLCACSSITPATMADVEKVREDGIAAATKQRDAFRDHLVANPGDVAGATGKAFDTNVSAQADAKANAGPGEFKGTVAKGLGAWEQGGVGALFLLIAGEVTRRLLKRHDAKPFEGPNGEKVPEADIVAAALAHKAATAPAAPKV